MRRAVSVASREVVARERVVRSGGLCDALRNRWRGVVLAFGEALLSQWRRVVALACRAVPLVDGVALLCQWRRVVLLACRAVPLVSGVALLSQWRRVVVLACRAVPLVSGVALLSRWRRVVSLTSHAVRDALLSRRRLATCAAPLTFAALLACGSPARDLPGGGPRFVTEGSCSPSTRSVELPLVSHETRCLRPLSRPTLVETAADYLAAFEPGCTAPELDLQQHRVLIIPARGAADWFVFPHFVHQRADAVEVGLISRPQGALPPDQLLVLDRDGPPLELRWCRSVCVSGCDAPLP